MSEAKWYIAANHNHASYDGAGCPVVFRDQSRATRHAPGAVAPLRLTQVLAALARRIRWALVMAQPRERLS